MRSISRSAADSPARCSIRSRFISRANSSRNSSKVLEPTLPPSMLVIAHRSQVQRAAPQALIAAIKTAGDRFRHKTALATAVQIALDAKKVMDAADHTLIARMPPNHASVLPRWMFLFPLLRRVGADGRATLLRCRGCKPVRPTHQLFRSGLREHADESVFPGA